MVEGDPGAGAVPGVEEAGEGVEVDPEEEAEEERGINVQQLPHRGHLFCVKVHSSFSSCKNSPHRALKVSIHVRRKTNSLVIVVGLSN